jgi:hypothetical protein
MKTMFKLFIIVFAILFTTQIYAQDRRSQSVSLTVENGGNIECSHTATLIVSYLYNGNGYSQVSNTVAMGHHIPETLMVSIPAGATLLDRKLRIDKNSDVIIHTVTTTSTGNYNVTSSLWCDDPVYGFVQSIYFHNLPFIGPQILHYQFWW